MNLTLTVIRGLSLLLTVLILIYLSIKTKENLELTVKFKYETLDAIKADSLEMEQKFSLLENETTRYSGKMLEDTSHVREAFNYLIGVIGLLIAFELGFIVVKRKTKGRETN